MRTLVVCLHIAEAIEAEKKKASQTDSVESYEAAFQRIQEMTKEEDIDYLVNHFIEVEDRNFALFNYVNEQNNEKELLEEQIMQVRPGITSHKLLRWSIVWVVCSL